MSDEVKKPTIAELAKAQQDRRQATQDAAKKHESDAATRVANTQKRWRELHGEYQAVVDKINGELAETDSRVSLRWDDKAVETRLGSVTATVVRKGMASNLQNKTMQVMKSGAVSTSDILRRGDNSVRNDLSIDDIDSDWLDKTLREFLSKAFAS